MSSVDYMAFEQGMMTAEQQSRRASNAWSAHANGLQSELNEMAASKDGNALISNGAIQLIKEMLAEINQLNPNSPMGDYQHVKDKLKQYSLMAASQQGFILDYENNKAYSR